MRGFLWLTSIYYSAIQKQEIDTLDNNFISITFIVTSRFRWNIPDQPIDWNSEELNRRVFTRSYVTSLALVCFENFQDFDGNTQNYERQS